MDGLRREKGEPERVKTFSVGFDVAEFSELHYARRVAERYGTEHHEITVGFKDFAEELPFLAWSTTSRWESLRHSHLLHVPRGEEARERDALREGADEQFGGYSKYLFDQFSSALDWVPSGVRGAVLRGLARGLPFEGRRLRQHG